MALKATDRSRIGYCPNSAKGQNGNCSPLEFLLRMRFNAEWAFILIFLPKLKIGQLDFELNKLVLVCGHK